MDDKQIVQKLKSCKSEEELKILGKQIGYELTDDEAKQYFKELSLSGELSDEELCSVSGGGCVKWRRGSAYRGNPPHKLIVTIGNRCPMWTKCDSGFGIKGTCASCISLRKSGFVLYCEARQYDKDPVNP